MVVGRAFGGGGGGGGLGCVKDFGLYSMVPWFMEHIAQTPKLSRFCLPGQVVIYRPKITDP